MRALRFVLPVLLVLAPSSVRAAEAVFGVEGLTQFNTNVFYQTENGQKAGSFRGGPSLILRDRTGQLGWKMRYRPSYEAFYNVSGIDSFYHLADGEISWRPSAATELYANDIFSFTPTRSVSFESETGNVLAQTVPDFANDQVLQNTLNLGIRHAFTPRWLADVSVSSSILDYQGDIYTDSSSLNGQAFATYGLTAADRIGGGFGYSRQTIEPPIADSSTTSYYQLYTIWNHDFSPTFRFQANAGPTLVDSPSNLQESFSDIPEFSLPVGNGTLLPINPASCEIQSGVVNIGTCNVYTLPIGGSPPFLTANQLGLDSLVTLPLSGSRPDSGGTSLTYFANLSVTKQWRNFSLTASYVRNASTTSGINQSVITDTYRLFGAWRPSPLWEFLLTGLFIQRTSDADQPQYFVVGQVAPGAVPCSLVVFGSVVDCGTLPGVRATGVAATLRGSAETRYSTYLITTQINRYLSRSTYVYARFTWDRQNTRQEFEDLFTESTSLATSSYLRYVVAIGFVYEFDPIHLAWD